jgi:hypothetical protein
VQENNGNDNTTITLLKATRDRLAAIKDHHRQSFDELLNKLLDEKEGKE